MRRRAILWRYSMSLAALVLALSGFRHHAWADTAQGSGADALPCNDLCRAWLALGAAEGPAVERRPAPVQRHDISVPAPKGAPAGKSVRAAKVVPHPAREPKAIETGEASRPAKVAKRVPPRSRSRVEVARTAAPVPVRRPASLMPGSAAAADAPSASQAVVHPVPEEGSAAPSGSAGASRLGPAPAQAGQGGAVTVATPADRAVSARSLAPPLERAGETPREATAGASPGRTALVNGPTVGPDVAALPAAPAPDGTRMAALPLPAVAAPQPREPSTAGKERIDGSDGRRPDGPLSVKIGRVGAEGGGTAVHVVVINGLQGDVKDVDVRCEARDAQGMQVGDAETRIADVAKAEVAFGSVRFPSELTAANSRFSCIAARFAVSVAAAP